MPEDEVELVSWTAAAQPAVQMPCGACRSLRRRCVPGCVFAPYFPPGEPHKFANVHKVFGASNVSKLLQVCVRAHCSTLSARLHDRWPS